MRRTVIEVLLVALLAAATAGALLAQHPLPRVSVGNRTWAVSWAVPAEDQVAGGAQVTSAFPDGRAHSQSLRQVVELSLAGAAIRVRFTNEDGDRPLELSRVTVAPALPNGAIDTHRRHELHFNDEVNETVVPGTEATSDPVPMAVTGGEQLAISMAVSGTSPAPTLHQFAGQVSAISAPGSGDVTRRADGSAYSIHTTADFWLATVEVLNPPRSVHLVAALGDSQTDAYLLSNGDQTWPSVLTHRLAASAATASIGIINSGLTGNTVSDVGCPDCGVPMDKRVIRDAVNLPGVNAAIVLGGTNDISRGATIQQVVHGLAAIAAILHAHHMRAIAMTIPPRAGGSFGWVSARMDPIRAGVNGWLRGQRDFDALIDIDRVLADPRHPNVMAPAYARGDGTHLNAAGSAAVAAAVPTSVIVQSVS